jgi:hypothetical protein
LRGPEKQVRLIRANQRKEQRSETTKGNGLRFSAA